MQNNSKQNISAQGIKDDALSRINESHLPHKEILTLMLERVDRVNFKSIAGIPEEDEIPQWQLIVIVVDELLNLTRLNRWGLCKHRDFLYLYNGAYWHVLDADELTTFLGEVSNRLSVPLHRSRHFDFRKKLIKQFNTVANMPAPENDSETTCINLLNGTLEIGSQKTILRPFNRNDFLKYQLPFQFNSKTTAPKFQNFLDEVLPQKELQFILAEYIAYLFIPNHRLKLEKTLLLYGVGANGKSVFFDIINALLGRDNISTYTLANLTNDNGYYRAMLGNKLLNYASEINRKLDTSFFKQLVSGEPIEARLPYGNPFILENYAKLLFNTNELPVDVEHTNAYFRRFIIIPFDKVIPDENQDKNLAQKIIKSELPGVLNWVLEGLNRLTKKENFTHSDLVLQQVTKYKQEADTTFLFIEENGYIPDESDTTTLKDLYASYKAYCYENNYRLLSNRNFKKRLVSHHFLTQKTRVGQVVYCTINHSAYLD